MLQSWSQLTRGQKAVYAVGVLAVFAVVGPILGAAALAAKSLVMFGVWAAAAAVAVTFWPVIDRATKTVALRLMKANARLNPIETLELDLNKKKDSLKKFVQFVTEVAAGYKVTKQEYDELKKDYPDRDLSNESTAVNKMGEAVELLRAKAKEAGAKLTKYEEELVFMKRNHAFAKRVGGAMAQLRNVEGVDALDELLKNEAIGQVRQDVAMAFAELDQLLDQEGTREVLLIAHEKSPETIEGSAFEIPHFFESKPKTAA